jgi:hypothetical protein
MTVKRVRPRWEAPLEPSAVTATSKPLPAG